MVPLDPVFFCNSCSNADLLVFFRSPTLPARAQGKGPRDYLNTSFKSMLRFCIIINNLAKYLYLEPM